jgi:OmpA-OmpF porin, OOP family
MLLRRSLPFGLGFAAVVGLGSTPALAQPAPAAPVAPAAPTATAAPAEPAAAEPAAAEPLRFTLDIHGGLVYRVGNGIDPEPLNRLGGLVGLDALLGTNKWWAAGIGYDHAFLGTEREDSAPGGAFIDQNRSLDELWLLGRVYPWQNDNVALWVQLGLGPVWQTVNISQDMSFIGSNGDVMLTPSACTAHSTPGLGMRGGVGVDVALNNTILFFGDFGVDHFFTSSSEIGTCGPGLGPATFLATRFGFAFATGRVKPPPPPPPPAPPSDRDGDAILDNVDACPDQPGLPNADPTKNGCPPPPDRDHDGVPDDVDACPDLPGPPSDDPKLNGCPDRDGDKIIDPLDACPDRPGPPNADPKENGCPPDSDGDGIRDDVDACPHEKGLPNADPKLNGCPLVAVREKEIVISQQVQFEVDKSTIKKESDELLDTVAAVIIAYPEIKRIEVQGHTDNSGTERHNKILSGARAESVKQALVRRHVQDRRLVAKGYGQEVPIADNGTEEGKAKNRRVQFVILERKASDAPKPQPAQAPPPPPKAPPPPPKK